MPPKVKKWAKKSSVTTSNYVGVTDPEAVINMIRFVDLAVVNFIPRSYFTCSIKTINLYETHFSLMHVYFHS